MKKRIYSLMFVLGFTTLAFAQYNLFDAADCDADGWLWFDNQAKINKYIGQADNDYGKSNPDGKVIQMVCADFGDYEDTTVDPTVIGYGTDGELEGPGARTGAIKLASSSSSMSTNGGGIIIRVPSLSTLSIALSTGSKVYVRLLGSTTEGDYFTDYKVVSAKYSSFFKPLCSAGQFTWTGMETLNSGYEPIFDLQSDGPIIAYIQSLTKYPVYIHGIKVTTPTPSGIQNTFAKENIAFDGKILTANQTSAMAIYNLAGQRVLAKTAQQLDCSKLARGVYIAKVKNGTQQVAQKIVID